MNSEVNDESSESGWSDISSIKSAAEVSIDGDEAESDEDKVLVRNYLKKFLKKIMEKKQAKRKKESKESPEVTTFKKKLKSFRIPKEHPKFSGKPADVDSFLQGMELAHAEFTNEEVKDLNARGFISKLVPYFEESSGAQSWFKRWASERTKDKKRLAWVDLVEGLRTRYSGYDQPRLRYDEYLEMKQTGDVNSYISLKSDAALQCSDCLTPKSKLFGFCRGLKQDIRTHVNLQRPKNLEEAEDYAMAFESSHDGTEKKKDKEAQKEKKSGTKRKGAESVSESGPAKRRSALSPDQRAALKELRELRKGKCFKCGGEGHERSKCSAPPQTAEAWRKKINSLKEKLPERP